MEEIEKIVMIVVTSILLFIGLASITESLLQIGHEVPHKKVAK
jgi:hypothetical protein